MRPPRLCGWHWACLFTVLSASCAEIQTLESPEQTFVSDDPNYTPPQAGKGDETGLVQVSYGTDCRVTPATIVAEHGGGLDLKYPQIAVSQGAYGLVWLHRSDSFGAHPAFAAIDHQGETTVSARLLTEEPTMSSFERPDIGATAQGFAMVWAERTGYGFGDGNVVITTVDLQGNETGRHQLTDTGATGNPSLPEQPPGGAELNELAVAWEDRRGLVDFDYSTDDWAAYRRHIYLKVVGISGEVRVNERRITQPSSRRWPNDPRLASNGKNYVATWHNYSGKPGEGNLFFSVLDEHGVPRWEEDSIGVSEGTLIHSPDLVWTAAEFGMVSSDYQDGQRTIRLMRIDDYGKELGRYVVSSYEKPCRPAISHNGEHYGLVWQNDCYSKSRKLYFALVDGQGRPLNAGGSACPESDSACGLHEVTVDDGEQKPGYPEMVASNGNFAMVWQDLTSNRIYFSQVICNQQTQAQQE